jgi:hypothetical protein
MHKHPANREITPSFPLRVDNRNHYAVITNIQSGNWEYWDPVGPSQSTS